MTRSRAPQRRSLSGDTRGAMMVIGLVMAIFLVAALYYVVGIAETITQRETMQDAADASAFSAAVLHARGMNVIVLINVVMAALLAVLVALKLVEAVLGIAIVLLAIAAFFGGTVAAGLIPDVFAAQRKVRSTHDSLRKGIFPALEALHMTARGVRAIVPWTAQLRVLQVARQNGPHAFAGFAIPPHATLPTEDGKFSTLCEHAGDFVGKTASLAIPSFLPGDIRHAVGDAIGNLAKSRADWFCGAKGGETPSTPFTEKRALPALDARTKCEAYSPGDKDYDADKHKTLCDKAARAERRWDPNAIGDCTTKECEERAERARKECKPDPDHKLYNWMYQVRTVDRKWGYRPNAKNGKPLWVPITDEVVEGPVLIRPEADKTEKRPPCGIDLAYIAPEWNEQMHPDGKPDDPLPVCATAPAFPAKPTSGFHETRITEVTQVYGCMEIHKTRIKVDDVTKKDRIDPADADARKSPQIAVDADLGGDGYQLRGIALGTLPRAAPENVVRVASWGQKTGSLLHAVAEKFGHMSFAQAEYYYVVEDPKEPDESRWLWNMNWTARLRRFRLPEPDTSKNAGAANPADEADATRYGAGTVANDVTGACEQVAANADGEGPQPDCAATESSLRDIQNVIVH